MKSTNIKNRKPKRIYQKNYKVEKADLIKMINILKKKLKNDKLTKIIKNIFIRYLLFLKYKISFFFI